MIAAYKKELRALINELSLIDLFRVLTVARTLNDMKKERNKA